MAVLEVFLAIVLIYIVLSQIQISLPAKYSDTANTDRLNRYSHDIAFALCGNFEMRRMLLNDTMAFDLNSSIPTDIAYHVYAYKNASNNHLLESLVYNYGAAPTYPSATSACLIAGSPNASTSTVSVCDYPGGDCLTQISSNDNNRVNLAQNQNFTMSFVPSRNGSMVELFLEGYHNQTGMTTLYDSAGNQIASYSFSTSADEIYVFSLSDFLPDSRSSYNITVKPNVNASYDYAYLNVSKNVYSPKKVVVQTWNAGG